MVIKRKCLQNQYMFDNIIDAFFLRGRNPAFIGRAGDGIFIVKEG